MSRLFKSAPKPQKCFSLNQFYVLSKLNNEIFPVLNVALVSYRDLNLQNANKMTSL